MAVLEVLDFCSSLSDDSRRSFHFCSTQWMVENDEFWICISWYKVLQPMIIKHGNLPASAGFDGARSLQK